MTTPIAWNWIEKEVGSGEKRDGEQVSLVRGRNDGRKVRVGTEILVRRFSAHVEPQVGSNSVPNILCVVVDAMHSFGQFGKVTEMEEIAHKGFTYLTLEETDEERVKRCIYALNSTKFRGKVLKVALAKPKWREVWEERQKSDEKENQEKKERAKAKMERRAHATLLPAPTRAAKSSAYDGEDFLPSLPYGWMKIKGRYIPIMRLAKKGNQGGILIEPSKYAHNIQSILCFVKPLKTSKILTELPPNAIELDEALSKERKEEVTRWANGLIKQRLSQGNSIADYSKFNDTDDSDSQDDDGDRYDENYDSSLKIVKSKGENKKNDPKNKKINVKNNKSEDHSDSEFEVVSGSENSDQSDGDDYSDSFSDIEELMDRSRRTGDKDKKTKALKDSTSNKPGSSTAVDSQSKMMSVIDSILKSKQGSDYGDSDSHDFDLHPSSGESSDEEKDSKHALKSNNSDSTDESSDSEEEESDSEISAKSFSDSEQSGEDDETKVVDFSSDDEGAQVSMPIEALSSDSESEDEENEEKMSNESSSEQIEDDESKESNSVSDEDDLQINMQVDDESFEDEEEEEEEEKTENRSGSAKHVDDEESSSESDSNDIEEQKKTKKAPTPIVTGPERIKVSNSDDEDDIGLNIWSSAPVPKQTSSKPQNSSNDTPSSTESLSTKDEKTKKRKRDESSSDSSESDSSEESNQKVWAADLIAENKKYAYSELVREEDEKIFSVMKDDAASSKPVVKTFSFLSNRSSEQKPATTSASNEKPFDPLAMLDAISSSAQTSSKQSKEDSFRSRSRFGSDKTDGKSAGKETIDKSKMSLFGGLTAITTQKPEESSFSKASSKQTEGNKSTSGFVRSTEVDRIAKMWSGTKGVQRQMAERNHKLATKRVKSNKNRF